MPTKIPVADDDARAADFSAGEELDALGKAFDTILRVGRIRADDGREGFEAVPAGELL